MRSPQPAIQPSIHQGLKAVIEPDNPRASKTVARLATSWTIDDAYAGEIPWLPLPLSWNCFLTPRGGGFPNHAHATYDELCLVANHGSVIVHNGVEYSCEPGTVFLHRQGEQHGFHNLPTQEPHFWLVHFQADEHLCRACPRLADPDPAQRVWSLNAVQLASFQALFTRMMAESLHRGSPGHLAAMSGWLRLLLIQASRWSDHEIPEPPMQDGDSELANLWEILNEHVESPDREFSAALARRVPNYDSLRHRFKRHYGRSPRDHLQHLRIERAKQLLLETDLCMGDIGERLGYARHAEFSRAFHRTTGQTPRGFRRDPQWGRTLEGGD